MKGKSSVGLSLSGTQHMSVTRDWSWPSPPHNPQPPRVCCNTLTRSQIQEQEGSSGAMQSRDRVMELLIRLEPPLSSQSSEQGVCLCVCLGLSRNSWREPSLEIKAWLWVCVCSDNVIYKKKKIKTEYRTVTVIYYFILKQTLWSQTNLWRDTWFWILSTSKCDFTKTRTALHTTGYCCVYAWVCV